MYLYFRVYLLIYEVLGHIAFRNVALTAQSAVNATWRVFQSTFAELWVIPLESRQPHWGRMDRRDGNTSGKALVRREHCTVGGARQGTRTAVARTASPGDWCDTYSLGPITWRYPYQHWRKSMAPARGV